MAPRSQELSGDPFGLLLKQRIVFMGGEVEDFMADAIVSQLLLLDAQDPTKDIKIFINSPGGSVTAGMGIYDAMMLCKADVQTYCFGLAASMGAFLLGAGTRGKRYSMPNSRIMIHQPLGGASGQAVDIEIQAKEIMYHKANINRIMAEYTGQPLSKVEQDTDRDRYMSPIEAKEYGVIDHIIGGDSATFQVNGDTYAFPRARPDYISDLEGRDPQFGVFTPGYTGGSSARFRRAEMEPYTPSLQPSRRWWNLKEMTTEEYKAMLQKNKEAGIVKDKEVNPDDNNWMPPREEPAKKALPQADQA